MKEIKRISCRQYSLVPKWCEEIWPNAGFKELIAHCEDVDIHMFSLFMVHDSHLPSVFLGSAQLVTVKTVHSKRMTYSF